MLEQNYFFYKILHNLLFVCILFVSSYVRGNNMAFPKEFYKENIVTGIEKTSDPSSGVLLNPLDLVTPTPWATVKASGLNDTQEKKSLIFNDQAYKNRSLADKRLILQKLIDAKVAGFNIYIIDEKPPAIRRRLIKISLEDWPVVDKNSIEDSPKLSDREDIPKFF